MATTLRAVSAVVLLGLVSACSAPDDDSELQSALDGRAFVSESVEGFTLLSGTRVSIGFSSGELFADAGCNSMDGPYSIEGETLVVLGLGSTNVGCDPAAHAQDDLIETFLKARPRLQLVEPRLVMWTSQMRMTLLDREVAIPDRPLVGTHWEGDGFSDGSMASSMSSAATLFFDPNGSVTIDTSCQIGNGTYLVDGNALTFEGLAYDGASCVDSSHQTTSDKVLLVLSGAPVTFEIREALLMLHQGSIALSFRAAE